MQNQYETENILTLLTSILSASMSHVGNEINDPSMIKITTHVDFNRKNLIYFRFVKVRSLPTVREDFSPEIYQVESTHDSTLDRIIEKIH